MVQILMIDLHSMSNSAHSIYMTNVMQWIKADSHIMQKCPQQVEALQQEFEKEGLLIGKTRKSFYSNDIAQADHERDVLLRSYRKTVKGFMGISSPNMADAAKRLNQHLLDYNINPRNQLHKETGLLVSFIEDLETNFAAEIKTLNLSAFVSSLRMANEKVLQSMQLRTKEQVERNIGNLRSQRRKTDVAYVDLIRFVNAYAIIEGDAQYIDFIQHLNTEIKHFKEKVLSKRHRKTSNNVEQTDSAQDFEQNNQPEEK